MNQNIPITEKSEKIIADVFSRYIESELSPKILEGRTVIHMYPTGDTIDEVGEAHGFEDSLFFNFDIYNVKTRRVYKKKGFYDELDLSIPCRIRFFKDLSTMIIIDKRICLMGSQSVLISQYD